jgi:hypothetical protein
LKYTILKFLNKNQKTEALILVNHGKDKALSLRLFFKYNRWVASLNRYAEALMAEDAFRNAVLLYHDIFATKEDGKNLKSTFTILYASDLEYMVDCDKLLGCSDSDEVFSDADFYSQWQPRAIDAVIDEMVETVGGGKHCKILNGN